MSDRIQAAARAITASLNGRHWADHTPLSIAQALADAGLLAPAGESFVEYEFAPVFAKSETGEPGPENDSLESAKVAASHILQDPQARAILGNVSHFVTRTSTTYTTDWEAVPDGE